MTDRFDPYAEWLSIPEDRRPPNYYDLLGLEVFEEEADKIREQGRTRFALVHQKRLGKKRDAALRLLQELSRAIDCLSDPKRKEEYDAALRAHLLSDAAPLVLTNDTPTKTVESATYRFGDSQLPAGSQLRAVEGSYQGPLLKLLVRLAEGESNDPIPRSKQERLLWLRARFVACDPLRRWLQDPERSFLAENQFGSSVAARSKTERSSEVDTAAEVELKPSSLRDLYNLLVREEHTKKYLQRVYEGVVTNAQMQLERLRGTRGEESEEVSQMKAYVKENQGYLHNAADVLRHAPQKRKKSVPSWNVWKSWKRSRDVFTPSSQRTKSTWRVLLPGRRSTPAL
jgi:curved DNA-binding protein CbpA